MSAAPGTPSEEIPDDRTCPVCGVGKSNSEEVEAQPGKRGAAPKRSAPRHFGEPFQKNRGGGIQSSPIFAIFVRRARCAVKNQINTMMKKILFLMAATAMMWGGVMQ
ncbi:rubredoxin [Alistipes sp.]|uniref:rubredoxin n=2 Tax=Alistipes TaxID=239759 RepID=UPI0023F1D02E|nr:rubredoxin [Alistipes sp.]